jgi:hypothetical protein
MYESSDATMHETCRALMASGTVPIQDEIVAEGREVEPMRGRAVEESLVFGY